MGSPFLDNAAILLRTDTAKNYIQSRSHIRSKTKENENAHVMDKLLPCVCLSMGSVTVRPPSRVVRYKPLCISSAPLLDGYILLSANHMPNLLSFAAPFFKDTVVSEPVTVQRKGRGPLLL